jgi:signal transduction histidine kinase/ligand-binding sensor domain-containing protein
MRYLLCLIASLPLWAAAEEEPTLVRVSFWIAPERHGEFAAAYEQEVAPILARFGLAAIPLQSRPTADSVFSRLFVLSSPAAWSAVKKQLEADSTRTQWRELTRRLAARFGASRPDGTLKANLNLYSAPAGRGRAQGAGNGQQRALGPGKGNWRTYDATNGLAGPWIMDVLQDYQGYLWFATFNDGVSRFDGQNWTTFSSNEGLADNRVTGLLQDRDRHLWFATLGGVSRYDGQHWTTYTDKDGLPDNRVTALFQDTQGRHWFATMGGVSRFDGQNWTSFTDKDGLADNRVVDLREDRRGHIWVATYNDGVSRYDGQNWTSFTDKDGLAENRVRSLFEDQQGHIWVGSAEKGVSRYDGRTWTTFAEKDGLVHNMVVEIFQDRRGVLWFGTYGGVSRYDGQNWTSLTTAEGLVFNAVYAICQDREGALWFGTSGGVNRYDEESFRVFGAADGISPQGVHGLFLDREGRVWFANGPLVTKGGGVSCYAGGRLTTYTTADGLADDRVSSVFQDRHGNLWFATHGGASRFDGRTFTTFTEADGLPDDEVNCIVEDPQGNLWFSSGDGVARYEGRRFEVFAAEDGMAGSGACPMLLDRQGQLWFGSADKGAARYDGQRFQVFTTREGLAHNDVLDIFEDREGFIWFATHGGLSRWDGQGFSNLSTQQGLSSNDVHAIAQAADGDLWIGTDGGGVSRYDGQVFQHLTREDGLASNVSIAIVEDGQGDLWVSNNNGITRYRSPPPTPLPTAIAAVVADRRYPAQDRVQIPTDAGLTAFEFRAMSFTAHPGQLAYLYRLRGHDPDWRQTRTNRVEYAGLTRGEYLFEVRAVDRDLNYSDPAQVRLDIHLPYAQIGWMASLGLALLLVGWQGTRLVQRDRRLRASNLELLQKTAALEEAYGQVRRANQTKSAFLASMSHELRTPLNAILGFTELLQGNREQNLSERQQRNLSTIHRNAGNLLHLINELLDLSKIEAGRTALQCEHFAVQEVVQEVAVMAEPLLRDKPVLLETACGELPLWLHSDKAKLKQILVNLVSNAVKFTREGRIAIQARAQGAGVEIAVQDSGTGIPAEKLEAIFEEFSQVDGQALPGVVGTGLGLAITRRLCQLLGGQIHVHSTVGQGSTFTVSLPLGLASETSLQLQGTPA